MQEFKYLLGGNLPMNGLGLRYPEEDQIRHQRSLAEAQRSFTCVPWYELNGGLAHAFENPDHKLLESGWPQVCRHTFRWINDKGCTEYEYSGPFKTPYGAKFSVLRRAVKSGYTRPKWWQYWRWNEGKI